ncbi:glycosyltransferase family 2 protein [Mucilaginibacter angelicae]|uniref:Glycosyltransferase family 2 protein n=1 Tax=Mucilaginibacter angelicae TaxID=869718 RepID=A0ABV6L556_9SPHI
MDKPLISICMPAFNAGAHILQTVYSVIGQTYEHWELIIIDDGSTDDTAQKLSSLADERIIIRRQENLGQCAACNEAFHLSKGNLIKFMDADDLLSANYLEAQEKALRNTTDAIAYSAWGRFYDDAVNEARPDPSLVTGDMRPFDWLQASMTEKEVMLQCALWLIPRNILLRSGLWDERLSLINDFEFFIRILLRARELKYAGGTMLYYRSGLQGSLSAATSAAAAESAYRSIDLGTGYLLEFSSSPEVKKIAADCFQRFIYSFYPRQPVLVEQAVIKVKQLGGSSLPFPAGGYTQIMARLLGWKMTRRIKNFLNNR